MGEISTLGSWAAGAIAVSAAAEVLDAIPTDENDDDEDE
jgi:hypothetical protein